MADTFIDLGRESSDSCCAPSSTKSDKKVYYPSLYISGVEGLNLSTGELEFRAKGKVVSISHRETEDDGEKWSCEIEVHAISAPGAEAEDDSDEDGESSLDKALNDISSKKKGKTNTIVTLVDDEE